MKPTRREVLASAGAGVVAGCSTKTDSSPAGDTAAGPATIGHVVVIMMENRSFDHMLGARKLLEGVAVDGLDATMANADADGNAVAPYATDVDCIADPGHGWNDSHDQWNEGQNDHFVSNYGGPEVMSYQTRDNAPVTYALADAYTTCDRYFCSVMGPTWPNRFYGHAGTSDGVKSNDLPDMGVYDFPTVWSSLDAAGVGWRYYFSDLPFIILFDNHWRDGTHGTLDELWADLESGDVPPVIWIDPAFTYNDDHPPHFVGNGQEWLAAVYSALTQSPIWDDCLVLLTYDEHGGFFDHVPPPTTDDDFAADGFDQMGFRVPVLAIGPYVKQGVVSTTFDHASWIRMVCDLHGLTPWNARIAAATSLADVLDTERMAARTPLPAVEIPIPDFSGVELGPECEGDGVFGPPEPDPVERPLRASLEPWHNLMRYLHREQDQTHRMAETVASIRAQLDKERLRRLARR